MTFFERQRRFPRYPCSYPITIVDHGTKVNAVCRSLSLGGFGATASDDLAVEAIVSIVFKPLLIEDKVTLIARILYHAGELYGFEFVAPAENQRELIAALFKEAVGEEMDSPEDGG